MYNGVLYFPIKPKFYENVTKICKTKLHDNPLTPYVHGPSGLRAGVGRKINGPGQIDPRPRSKFKILKYIRLTGAF